jgi:hypothetical protein
MELFSFYIYKKNVLKLLKIDISVIELLIDYQNSLK